MVFINFCQSLHSNSIMRPKQRYTIRCLVMEGRKLTKRSPQSDCARNFFSLSLIMDAYKRDTNV